MNKHRYRIIFNQLRGLMMVVAEHVKSHTSSTESGTTSSTTSLSLSFTTAKVSATAALRPLAFSLMCALGLVAVIPNPINISRAHAEAKAATNVPGNQQATVLSAPNGVEVVNIQTPSAAGVSRNVYEILNVPTQGMIFNNSRTNVQTELGGWIQGNPWLATGSARIILNEINSSNPSYLNGYMEIAGMARLPRIVLTKHPQHVIVRGNNREPIFVANGDYRFYLDKLQDACIKHVCDVHAYVLMTNHIHLLITPHKADSISKTMQMMGRYYVQYFNHTYNRTGTLWEGRYKASLVDSEAFALTC